MNNIELLAPAGSFEALKAAIAAGADAVYIGGAQFGARAYATNFDKETMVKAINYAHIYNIKVYVTVNTLIYDEEMYECIEYVKFLYEHDVDAIIVQDFGLMYKVKQIFPDFEMHASTQMTVHNLEAIKLLGDMDVKRVVLSRENTIDDIKYINDHTQVETEVFVHGALCVSYSGQCLMSSLIGGRSGNRGRCAQPCRKKYHLKLGDSIIEEDKYLLSPKDLNTIEEIDKIILSGVKSLKIEGRMKSPEYVAIVVSTYRKAIDQFYKSGGISIKQQDLKDLKQIFNRQFTRGFIFHDKGLNFINHDKNNHVGIAIGEVIKYAHHKVFIKLNDTLNVNDGIYFENTNEGMRVPFNAKNGEIVTVSTQTKVKVGTVVYKNIDVKLLESSTKILDSLKNKIPIFGTIYLFENQKPKLLIKDDLNKQVNVEIDFDIERSKGKYLENERILKQIQKLGDTPFYFKDLDIKRNDDIFITFGALNNLRRIAIQELTSIRQFHNKRDVNPISYEYKEESHQMNNQLNLSVYVRTVDQLNAARACNIERIYVDEDIMSDVNTSDVYLYKHRIDYNPTIDNQYKGTVIGNLGALNILKNSDQEIITDYSFNVTNSESIRFLEKYNADIVTLSYELNEQALKNIKKSYRENLEIIVYGFQEVMITKHCMFSSNCQKQCANEGYQLIDVKNEAFQIYMDKQCHTHILNSKNLILSEELHTLINEGYKRFRLQFTVEDFEETMKIIKAYKQIIEINNYSEVNKIIEKYKNDSLYTRGYYNKDIL